MKDWTIGRRVTTACVLLTGLALAASITAIAGSQQLSGDFKKIADENFAGLDSLTQLQAALLEVRGGTYLSFLNGLDSSHKSDQLAKATAAESRVPLLLRAYESTGAITPEERPLFEKLKAETGSFLAAIAHFRELQGSGKSAEAMEYWNREGINRWPVVRGLITDEIEVNRSASSVRLRAVQSLASTVVAASWCLLLLAVGVGMGIGIFAVRSVNRALQAATDALRSSAGEVSGASVQVANASEQLAQGASEQAASLEETSASGQQISAMTQRNAENSRTAATLMAEVDGNIALANKKLSQMVASMGEITQSSERIAKIIKVIDEIAFQTNILALNAAVEAARAGESGLGFAVVAEEVRNLAQRSAQAAKDTTKLIEGSVDSARAGGTCLHQVAEVIRGITSSATKVKALVDEVSLGGAEQARGIEQISRALVQMESTTQQTAATAEESASASQQLKAQAVSMGRIVLSLQALVKQPASHTPRSEARASTVSASFVQSRPASAAALAPVRRLAASAILKPKATASSSNATALLERSSFPLDDSEFQEF